MASEKAEALVLRTTDWSESSRIATLWSREFGKLRVLAKGGRRLRSAFENALDLLTLCSIVLLRKSSGGLDLLTEARVVQRFTTLTQHLPALYAGYYVAELLDGWTQEHDPHPRLFDGALATLSRLADREQPVSRPGIEVMRFESLLLTELGYAPVLEGCASCSAKLPPGLVTGVLRFSVAAGGVVCRQCAPNHRDHQRVSVQVLLLWKSLLEAGAGEQPGDLGSNEVELRRLLSRYVTYLQGRRPRLLRYLEEVDPNQPPLEEQGIRL